MAVAEVLVFVNSDVSSVPLINTLRLETLMPTLSEYWIVIVGVGVLIYEPSTGCVIWIVGAPNSTVNFDVALA